MVYGKQLKLKKIHLQQEEIIHLQNQKEMGKNGKTQQQIVESYFDKIHIRNEGTAERHNI